MTGAIRLLGIDPGLNRCGWGMVLSEGQRLAFLGCGVIRPPAQAPLSVRLCALVDGLEQAIARFRPDAAAMEETFVNSNPRAALILGQARGAAFIAPARAGLEVAEYSPATIKKALTGAGRADKNQIQAMVRRLLPAATDLTADSADALAVALCHAAHLGYARRSGVGA